MKLFLVVLIMSGPCDLIRGDIITLEGFNKEFTVTFVSEDTILLVSHPDIFSWSHKLHNLPYKKVGHILLPKIKAL